MLAKATADRYQTMTEVAQALEAVQASLGDPMSAPPPSLAPVTASPSLAASAGLQQFDTRVSAESLATSQTVDLASASALQGPSPKVLLVEPSRTQSSIIRRYLQAQGVTQVAAVTSGQEALQAAAKNCPEAIICTMHLPDMTGVELAQKIRAASSGGAPGFVLISSEAESAEAGTLSKCGKAIVLHKPFTPQQLGDALRVVAAPPSSAPGREKWRVLIVDDSTPARLHVRNVLKGLGLVNFVEAADGAQAVAAAARDTFDLIVTDYNMPFMDGRGLVGYLKQDPRTASVPIIMVTTEQDPAKLEAVRQLGVTAICAKSFPSDDVRKILDQLVPES
jgi:two-component system, chemotaxis family, chemotaxis protein CheY